MCRQHLDPAEWKLHGGPDLGDRVEWSDRACGMAALRLILLAYGQEAPSATELLHLGVKHQALSDRGWLHARIAGMAVGFGVPGRAEPIGAGDLPSALTAAPLIISVTEQFPDDGRKGGHPLIA